MSQDENCRQERHILKFTNESKDTVVLDAAAYSIGREKSNAIVLNSPAISRQHALLLRLPEKGQNQKYIYRLVDGDIRGQASKNGTFINDEPCSSQTLNSGDRISFGKEIQAKYIVSLNANSGTQMDGLEAKQYSSIKIKLREGKETFVAQESELVEQNAINDEIAHDETLSSFQNLRKDMLRFLNRKIF